ncbi:MAG TPA: ATP:cob(I)alamin adenosyltransferase, partial [Bacteroidota bacterium]|nr:ATP:cob(I)alamin adenosyltransferase [Bacteroidota bacterium]
MKIYTRKGDRGETSLFGGTRVLKNSLRIEAYGCVDELNSALGFVRSLDTPRDVDSILETVQNDLFVIGADLATPLTKSSKKIRRIQPTHVERLENAIDRLEASLPPLDS